LVILTSLDTPRGYPNQGGDVAAPIFAAVAQHALRALAVPPDDTGRVLRAVAVAPESLVPAAYRPASEHGPTPQATLEPGIMPDLRGRSAREAAITAARQGLVVQLRGSGRVVDQTPPPGTVIEAGLTCRLALSHSGGPR
jgi:cell division protein FtsI (penicillin-binding protein 3)